MNEQPALLSAVLATPDDDTPRLVYADWLDEHDQPLRAEFIRVQCEEARLSATVVHRDLDRRELARRTELRTRERALLRQLNRTLRAEAGSHHGDCALCLDRNMSAATATHTLALGRGFFAALTVRADTWSRTAELLRAHPLRVINFERNCARIWIRGAGRAWSLEFDAGEQRPGRTRTWASRAALVNGLVAWGRRAVAEL